MPCPWKEYVGHAGGTVAVGCEAVLKGPLHRLRRKEQALPVPDAGSSARA